MSPVSNFNITKIIHNHVTFYKTYDFEICHPKRLPWSWRHPNTVFYAEASSILPLHWQPTCLEYKDTHLSKYSIINNERPACFMTSNEFEFVKNNFKQNKMVIGLTSV